MAAFAAALPVVLYQTVSESFFVPDELLPEMPSEALSREMRAALRHHRMRNGDGHIFRINAKGRLRIEPQGEAVATEGTGEHWALLRLGNMQARELLARFRAILADYPQADASGDDTHLVHFAVIERAR
jgi:hypothetical protein